MAGLDRQGSQQARAHAISALKRSTSKREPPAAGLPEDDPTPPPLERSGSDRAREEAMRRLEGSPSPQPPASSTLNRSG